MQIIHFILERRHQLQIFFWEAKSTTGNYK